jgi:hypothetical protein
MMAVEPLVVQPVVLDPVVEPRVVQPVVLDPVVEPRVVQPVVPDPVVEPLVVPFGEKMCQIVFHQRLYDNNSPLGMALNKNKIPDYMDCYNTNLND